jgi:uncharacterized membrane protein (DUF4010 family)
MEVGSRVVTIARMRSCSACYPPAAWKRVIRPRLLVFDTVVRMTASDAFQTLGISLGLGLLVGLQRERAKSRAAGVRTFPLITVLGTLCAMLSPSMGGWMVVGGMLAVASAMVIANVLKMRLNDPSPSMTTELAALVMYAIGAYLVVGHKSAAVALAGAVVVLLYAKPILHGVVERMGEHDMRGLMQFALIALVILPILPDEPFGPFEVLNLRQIWWMVVLVSGISLGGYVAFKLFGHRAGAVLGGLLGGLISSTATTVSYAKRASHVKSQLAAATLVIMLASTVVNARVLFEVSIVARGVLPQIAGPVAVMMATALLLAAGVWIRHRKSPAELPPQDNPTELRAAITFGVLFAGVLLAVATARHYLGDRGIYGVAAISGLTDMDAITLSTSRLAAEGVIATTTAWRAIIIATIANLVFKAGIVALLGGPALLARVGTLFAINAAVGGLLLVLWPA